MFRKLNLDANHAHASPRVLMFVPQYPYPVVGGLERQSHELSKTLVHSLGVSVQVLSGKVSPGQPFYEEVEGIPVTRIYWTSWKFVRFLCMPFGVMFNLWRKRDDYDVIHLHQHSWIGLFVILVSRLLRKPILTKLPNVGELGIPGLRKLSFGKIRLAILLWSNGIVAMSKVSVDELLVEGYSSQRILTVPNGISSFSKRVLSVKAGKEQVETCSVVFVGRLSGEKGLDILLMAWRQVLQQIGVNARLELWGEGVLKKKLKHICSDLNIMDSVVFAGQVQDVRARLRTMDIFVLPSMFEGNSNAVLESMEAGLPIVATPVGGTPMQVGPEGASLLFPVGDVGRLADRLINLIGDTRMRHTYGQAMSHRVANYFDLEKVSMTYLCAYRQLVDGRNVNLISCGKLPSLANPCVV